MSMTPGTQTFSMNMILTGTTTSRLWNIRISQVIHNIFRKYAKQTIDWMFFQIPCGTAYTGEYDFKVVYYVIASLVLWNDQSVFIIWSAIIAPDNCLQYFTEPTGTITSFNYQYAATPLVQHLAYQDYNICIRTNQVIWRVSSTLSALVNNNRSISIDIGILWNLLRRLLVGYDQ